MMKEGLKAVCRNITEDNAIVQALQLPKRVNPSEVTRLLSYIDSIIEYYLQLDKKETIRYPIIYIPCAKDWAEEVCLEYVSYKIESTFDIERLSSDDFRKEINAPEGLGGNKGRNFIIDENKIRKVVRKAKHANRSVRNLIVCGQSIYNTLSKKQRLVRLFGDSPQTSIVCADVNTVKKTYVDYKAFENIFCFYNNKGVSDKYEIGSLFNWTGLNNCFIFEFSSTPYCVHNVLGCGKRLCDNLPHRSLLSQNNENIYPDFITLTAEESRYLFNEESQNAHVIIHYPSEIEEDINHVVDFYKGEDDDWHFSIKDRNILSLCLCQEAKTAYMDFLKQEKPILSMNYPEWNSFFNSMLERFRMQEIVSRILSFVQHYTIVAFVICDTPKAIKDAVKHFFFEQCGLTIQYYQYKDLKEKNNYFYVFLHQNYHLNYQSYFEHFQNHLH